MSRAKAAVKSLVPPPLRPPLQAAWSRRLRVAAAIADANPLQQRQRRLRRQAWALLDRGEPLGAYELLNRDGPTAVGSATWRQLWYDLESQGYLARALEVARRGTVRTAGVAHRLRRLEGQIAVLSGAFAPKVAPLVDGYVPIQGRVLHVVGKSLPHAQTGYTLRTHYTALAQVDAGLDPHVVTQMGFVTTSGGPTVETVDGVRYHRVPGPVRTQTPLDVWMSAHVDRVAVLVQQIRPAVLHAASDYHNAMTALAIGGAYGIPVVYESRGFWEETWLSRQEQRYGWDLGRLTERYGLPDFYLLRKAIEDRARRDADRVVTLAGVMADRIAEGGVDRDRIEVVPNAVDVSAFPILTRNEALAGRFGIEPGTVVIGYISSLAEYEGIDTLIAAYRRLSTRERSALLIVGDGPVRDELRAAAAGLADVHFTGQVPHHAVLDYYSLIDVFVVPRRPVEVCHLVTPLKPFEAFATGRTVVLSDVRALASIAEQSGAAELFQAGNVDSLTEVLTGLIADPARRRELADAGAAWVRAERTWAANAQIYRRLYDDMLGTAPFSSGASIRA